MKTHSTLVCCTRLILFFARLGRFGRKSQPASAVLFLLFMASAESAVAQNFSNCVTVICPPSVITNFSCDDVYTPAAYPIFVSNSCPNVQVQVNCNPPPGTPFPVGAHPVHCVVTASGQVVANCDFTIFVERDIVPPFIRCPSNVVVNACPGPAGCGAFVNFPPPVASDNSGSVTVTCTPASGTVFPCGTTPVTCVAEDACHMKDSCQFNVTVNPNGQPPAIDCPPDIKMETCSNSATITFTVGVTPPGTSVICTPPSGSIFPLGSSSVSCVASNGCGQAQCGFKVDVRQSPLPTIQCPTNPVIITVLCGSNCVPVFYPLPTVSNGALQICNPPPGTCLPIGIHTITCRATNDCKEAAICQFDVRVISGDPGQGPIIQCPSNIVTVAPCGSNCVKVTYSNPTVSNGALESCNPPSGSCFPLGVTTVICRATNGCGQVAYCSFDVRVIEGTGQPPSITCPSNIVVDTCRPNCEFVNYPLPPVANGVLVSCSPPPGSCFPLGVSAVTCHATNQCASSTCTFTVTVREVPPPTIQCPTQPVIVTAPCGSNCVPVSYLLPAVSSGSLVSCTPPPGTCLPVGSYTVTCTATNRCGQSKVCSFPLEVRLSQGQPPVIQCPTNVIVFRAPCGTNCVPVNYPTPVVSNGVLASCSIAPGTCLPIGDFTVDCVATNGCSASTCSFVIQVLPTDPAPPFIICSSNITVTAACGSNCMPVNYLLPTVNNGTLESCNPPPGTCFPIGVTTVLCRATNNCKLTATCSFDIRVVPGNGEGPTIRCPTNVTMDIPCNSNCVPIKYPSPTVVNGVLVGCNPPLGTCLPAGNHVVTCFATNNCGSASCEFIVSIIGQTLPPTIHCPSNRVVVLPCGSNCVPVFYPLPTVSDGVLVRCTPPSGSCLPVGIYNVSCFATNGCGLSTKCDFQIRVIQGQGEPPVIRCPSNQVVVAPCGTTCAPVTYPPPFVTNGVLESCSVPQNACLPIGTNTIVCRATNNCGSAICSFTITVVPGTGQPPGIKCPSNVVVTVPCGSNCVPVNYPLPTVSNGVLVGCNPPPGTCLQIGTYYVVCTASNTCGQTQCEFPLHVIGGPGHFPIINCPSNVTFETCSPNCTQLNYPLPSVVNGTLVGCNPPPTFCFPIGSTTVTCLATNACGSNTCTFVVEVRQIPFPQIVCPSNRVVTTCDKFAVVDYPSPTIPGVTPGSVTVTCNPPSGSSFPIGTNVVTCCVSDRCNRTNCCEFLIIVRGGNPCVKPPPGMVLWLPLDEPFGPIAHNIIPGAPNGGHIGGPAPLLGQYVLNSLRFDGINDFVRVPNYAAIMLNASDFSIDAWVRRDPPAQQGRAVIVSKLGQIPGAIGVRGYEYYLNNGVMNLFLGGVVAQNFNSGVIVPPDGNWHHVAVTVQRPSGGTVRFYIDGAVVNAQPGPITAPLSNQSSLFVGAGTLPGPNGFFRGAIDEVEIFRRALTVSEVASLWNAQQSGKCKISCAVPMQVPVKPGGCVTITVRVCNETAVPQTINWAATGAAIAAAQSGSFVLPPFTCTNVPVTLCSPATTPSGAVLPWSFSIGSDTQCPVICVGSVVSPGVVVIGPTDPTSVPGTNTTGTIRVGLNGLPPGAPLRILALDSDMMPDTQFVSLNGLPPGTPWDLVGILIGLDKPKSKSLDEGLDIPIRFADSDPARLYTIMLEADLDGDGAFEPLGSFIVENPVVTPPTLRLVNGQLWWDDQGDGFGQLEAASSIEGPWTPVPGGPGTPIDADGAMKFYRVAIPTQ